MAGAAERQALKLAALQALGDSRIALGGELLRVRREWSPGNLIWQSVDKHKIALMVVAALAGLGATRFFMTPRRENAGGGFFRGKLAGLAATTLWSIFQEPALEFARTHFASYFGGTRPSPDQEKTE